MEKIIVFFIDQRPSVVRVNFEASYYITFQSLYPYIGISADYFNDEVCLNDIGGEATLKTCLYANLLPYHIINCYAGKAKTSRMEKGSILRDSLDHEIKNYLSDFGTNYISKIAIQNIQKAIADFIRFKAVLHSYDTLSPENVEALHNSILGALNEELDEILFYNYQDDGYSGLKCTNRLDLTNQRFPEERLLQEIIEWISSLFQGRENENKFFTDFLRKRFHNFSEMKKISLFQISNNDTSLSLYKDILMEWWHARY